MVSFQLKRRYRHSPTNVSVKVTRFSAVAVVHETSSIASNPNSGPTGGSSNGPGPSDTYHGDDQTNSIPSAQGKGDGSGLSSTTIYGIIGVIIVMIIVGVVVFVVLRKRKQGAAAIQVSPTNSVASSMVSTGDIYGNA